MVTDPILSFSKSWAPRRIGRLISVYLAVAIIPPALLFAGYGTVGFGQWLHSEHPWWLEFILLIILFALIGSIMWDRPNSGEGSGYGFASVSGMVASSALSVGARSSSSSPGDFKIPLILIVSYVAWAVFPIRIDLHALNELVVNYWHEFLKWIW